MLLGNGDGSFGSPVNYGTGASPVSVAAGDFNGDGSPDLAVANYSDAKGVSVLVNKGGGAFKSAVNFEVGVDARFVLVSEFNGDGNSDLAVAHRNGVSVLLGLGNATFHASVSYDAIAATSLATGDLNGDGRMDLIAVGHGASYSPGGSSILLGNGDGTFQPALTHTGHSLSSVVIGDFNRDGKPDFATVWSDDIAGTPISVWLNTACSRSPGVGIARGVGSVIISWPFPSSGFLLESSPNLSPTSWTPADVPPVNSDGRWEFSAPTIQGQHFFRLRKP